MADQVPVPSMKTATSIQRAADFQELYANHVRVNLTPYDMAIVFGRIVEREGAVSAVDEQIAVRLSPQTFKAVTISLHKILAAYEAQFGVVSSSIKNADEMLESLKSAITQATQVPKK